tara:strand:+ start:7324 stop:7659 length:336 start_codon:yes stop_codon:yes gene_type:complete
MSEKDLVKELKSAITDLTQDRDDALAKVKSKEARLKQVLIKLEHATQDVQSMGHKIGDKDKELAKLHAKLETKDKLLQEAVNKIKGIHDDSTEKTTEEIQEDKDEDTDSDD